MLNWNINNDTMNVDDSEIPRMFFFLSCFVLLMVVHF